MFAKLSDFGAAADTPILIRTTLGQRTTLGPHNLVQLEDVIANYSEGSKGWLFRRGRKFDMRPVMRDILTIMSHMREPIDNVRMRTSDKSMIVRTDAGLRNTRFPRTSVSRVL